MKIDIRERDNVFTLSDKVREVMENAKDSQNDVVIWDEEKLDNYRIELAITILKPVYVILLLVFAWTLGTAIQGASNVEFSILGLCVVILSILTCAILKD